MIPDEVAVVFTPGIALGIWGWKCPEDGRIFVAILLPMLQIELYWGEAKETAAE